MTSIRSLWVHSAPLLFALGAGASFAMPASSARALDLFDCQSGSAEDQVLCSLIQSEINEEIGPRGLRLTTGGLLVNYDNPAHVRIDTGHSCSHTAEVMRTQLKALIGRDIDMDLRGDLLDEPLVATIQIPVRVDVRMDFKSEYGYRILGSCNDAGSDSYHATGSIEGVAKAVVALALHPTEVVDAQGNLTIVLTPRVRVLTALEGVSMPNSLQFHGVSPIAPVLGFALGIPGTVTRLADTLFRGGDVGEFAKQQLYRDIGFAYVLTAGSLPGSLEERMLRALDPNSLITEEAAKAAAKFGPDIEDALNATLRELLHLDASGKRAFAIAPNFMSLIDQYGEDAAVFLATANAGADRTAYAGYATSLLGTGTASTGALGYAWRQVSGPAVTLQNANTARVSFTAPSTLGSQVVLELRVTDAGGSTATDQVTVRTVQYIPPPIENPPCRGCMLP